MDVIKVIALELPLLLAAAVLVGWLYRRAPRVDGHSRTAIRGEWRAWREASAAHRATSLLVLAAAATIRIYYLRQPMRYDEAYTFLYFSSGSLMHAMSDYTFPNNHILHTICVWLVTRLFGSAPSTIRLPAFIAGLLLVVWVYVLARRLGGQSSGLAAAASAAVMPSLILYSTNARGYTMICLAFVVLLWLATEVVEQESPGLWCTIAVVLALGMYTAPVMVYPGGVACAWVLVEAARCGGRRSVVRIAPPFLASIALAGVLSVAVNIPVVVRLGIGALVSNSFVIALPVGQFIAAIPAFARSLVDSLALGIPLPLVGMLVVVAAIGIAVPPAGPRRSVGLVVVTVVWSTIVLAATRRPPPARTWLFLVPLGCVFAGLGIGSIAERLSTSTRFAAERIALVVTACVSILICGYAVATRAVIRSTETGVLESASAIARQLATELRPRDVVVMASPSGPPLEYYLRTSEALKLEDFIDRERARRLFVVVNDEAGQTLQGVIRARRDIPWGRFAGPTSWRQFPGARLYAFTKMR